MTTSSSTNFELAVDDYIEEAFERCGLEIRTGYDLKTAKRSLNLMLADWANRGLNQWTIEQRTQTVTADDTEYDLGTDVTREGFYSQFGYGSTFPQVVVGDKNLGGCIDAVKYLREQKMS